MDLTLELDIVAENLAFAEGPIWMPDGSVLVCEIAAGQITQIFSDKRKRIVARTGGGPNGAALGPNGRLYVCNNGGTEWLRSNDNLLLPSGPARDYTSGRIEIVDLAKGSTEVLYDACDGFKLSAPNDIVFDELGGFYFTDFGQPRERESDRGGVFYASADGSMIKPVAYPMDHPNGCGLSPDGKILYVALSFYRTLVAFDIVSPGVVKINDGLLSELYPGRAVAQFPYGVGLDSLGVLANGHVAVASYGDGCIAVVDPETSEYVRHVCPDKAITNICFGGDDMRDAWITQSSTLIKVRWESAGLKLAHYS